MSMRSTGARPGTHDTRLARLLDSPHLARLVPHVAPELLHQLVRQRGLDACADLVAAATPRQLTAVCDLDLWRPSGPGGDEHFDASRFGEWLEFLAATGGPDAASVLGRLDVGLVVAGLSRHIRVFDPGTFEPTASSDDEAMEPGHVRYDVSCELGGYLVAARRTDAWEAIVTLLPLLEAEHPDRFDAVMRGCRRASNAGHEIDGLDDLLTTPEQLMHDEAIEREQRRAQQGYCTPADARAFLDMARRPRRGRHGAAHARNPIVAAYFRAAGEAATTDEEPRSPSGRQALPAAPPAAARRLSAEIGELLAEAGVLAGPPRARLEGSASSPRPATIQRLMNYIGEADPAAWLDRNRELAFLGNALLAGCSLGSRPFTRLEASDAVVATCNLGLEQWPARWPDATERGDSTAAGAGARLPDAFLEGHDLVTAFEAGWSTLHEDVGMYAARRLLAVIEELHCVDAEVHDGLRGLRGALRTACEAGMPWQARDALDAIAALDLAAWNALLGVTGECPVIPDALTAVLERRTGAVSSTAFEFVATTSQIGAVHAFIARLPAVLGV